MNNFIGRTCAWPHCLVICVSLIVHWMPFWLMHIAQHRTNFTQQNHFYFRFVKKLIAVWIAVDWLDFDSDWYEWTANGKRENVSPMMQHDEAPLKTTIVTQNLKNVLSFFFSVFHPQKIKLNLQCTSDTREMVAVRRRIPLRKMWAKNDFMNFINGRLYEWIATFTKIFEWTSFCFFMVRTDMN